jgi:hypothetical protein
MGTERLTSEVVLRHDLGVLLVDEERLSRGCELLDDVVHGSDELGLGGRGADDVVLRFNEREILVSSRFEVEDSQRQCRSVRRWRTWTRGYGERR